MKFTSRLFSSIDQSLKDENMSATCLRWFASDTVHIVFIHITSVVKSVHIVMARRRVSRSCIYIQYICIYNIQSFN